MRTTRPQIQSTDNLTISTGIAAVTHFFRRSQDTFQELEPENVSQSPIEPQSDSVELSRESLFRAPNRGEELCSSLMAAWN